VRYVTFAVTPAETLAFASLSGRTVIRQFQNAVKWHFSPIFTVARMPTVAKMAPADADNDATLKEKITKTALHWA
jgi:hypothetical protein